MGDLRTIRTKEEAETLLRELAGEEEQKVARAKTLRGEMLAGGRAAAFRQAADIVATIEEVGA